MKAMIAIVGILVLRLVGATGRTLGSGIFFGADRMEASQVPPSPAAAGPAPAPGLPGLEALHITFEIMNFNYFDLTKVTCPKKVKFPKSKAKAINKKAGKGSKKGPAFKDPLAHLDKALPTIKAGDVPEPNVTKAIHHVHGHSDAIAKEVQKVDDFGKGVSGKPPWMEKKGKKEKAKAKDGDDDDEGGASMLQVAACAPMPDLAEAKSEECTTVMDVLRDAIKETVRGIIDCLYAQSLAAGPAGAPGPSPAGAATLPVSALPAAPAGVSGLVPLPPQAAAAAGVFLQNRALAPAPALAAGPAPAPIAKATMPEVKIFVTFSPGREMEGGRSTIAEIAFLDTPKNGLNDVAMVMPLVGSALESGLLKKQVKKALKKVTGIKPKLHKVELKTKVIEQWDVVKCEEHIKGIVQQFTLHYTRNQVPMALYNECTNFMTKMSFSHDYVLDPQDTVRCRRATAKFASHWGFGENAKNSDFEDMCIKACEAKYGRNAPTCNLHSGDGLIDQPLL